MNYNDLSTKAHENAVRHGFWEKRLSNGHCLMLVITEVAELVEADRKNMRANTGMSERLISIHGFNWFYQNYVKGSVEEEFADIAIRLFDLAGAWGIDFTKMRPCGYYRAFDRFSFTENAFALCKGLSKEAIGIEKRIQFGVEYVKKWAETLKIDLSWHIDLKMKYNENRPIRHNKKY